MAIEITSFRKHEKNTLQGFMTIRLTSIGLEIRDCTVHRQNEKQWIGLPARSYEDNGETKWAKILDFYDPKAWSKFQTATHEALEDYLKHKAEKPIENNQDEDNDIPF